MAMANIRRHRYELKISVRCFFLDGIGKGTFVFDRYLINCLQ